MSGKKRNEIRVTDIPDPIFEQITALAKTECRSKSKQVVYMLTNELKKEKDGSK